MLFSVLIIQNDTVSPPATPWDPIAKNYWLGENLAVQLIDTAVGLLAGIAIIVFSFSLPLTPPAASRKLAKSTQQLGRHQYREENLLGQQCLGGKAENNINLLTE